jgi:hypothetical protein
MKYCPQCGTAFEPSARFCMECGFDKTTLKLVEPSVTSAPGIVVEEIINEPVIPVKVSESKPEDKSSCPQCGGILDKGDRFCQNCGFENSAPTMVVNTNFKPVDLPDEIYKPEEKENTLIADTATPKIHLQEPKPFIPEPAEPIVSQTTEYVSPGKSTQPFTFQKRKKSWPRIPLYIFLLAVLGIAGWLGYNLYLNNQEQTPHETVANMGLPPVTETTETTTTPDVSEEPVKTVPEQPKETAKPQSKIDQELAKQKAKEQNKSTQKTAVPTQKPKPENVTKESTNSTASEKPSKIIFEVGRKEEPKSKNPKNPTKFSIQEPTMIVRITTDHYNSGMGTPRGGIITIKDKLGNTIGSYKAFGKTGKNGTPSAKWVCEPHIILEKGSYMIMDSDMPTWSKTFLGTGFVVIEGYEVD